MGDAGGGGEYKFISSLKVSLQLRAMTLPLTLLPQSSFAAISWTACQLPTSLQPTSIGISLTRSERSSTR